VLFYPLVDYLSDTASYQKYADGPWLTRRTMKWMFGLQGLDGSEDYHAYPLRATVEQLRGLPDALLITDDDILQDEGEAYAYKLAQAGARVTTVRYNGRCTTSPCSTRWPDARRARRHPAGHRGAARRGAPERLSGTARPACGRPRRPLCTTRRSPCTRVYSPSRWPRLGSSSRTRTGCAMRARTRQGPTRRCATSSSCTGRTPRARATLGSSRFFGSDEVGTPGSILTFFPWPGARRGRRGSGQVAVTAFSVPPGAVGFWADRLLRHNVRYDGPSTRGTGVDAEQVIALRDPDGLHLELVAHPAAEGRPA
jgi:catechol 2,3-dioxygenase-like lactoylglutathione lyase family enzyme